MQGEPSPGGSFVSKGFSVLLRPFRIVFPEGKLEKLSQSVVRTCQALRNSIFVDNRLHRQQESPKIMMELKIVLLPSDTVAPKHNTFVSC